MLFRSYLLLHPRIDEDGRPTDDGCGFSAKSVGCTRAAAVARAKPSFPAQDGLPPRRNGRFPAKEVIERRTSGVLPNKKSVHREPSSHIQSKCQGLSRECTSPADHPARHRAVRKAERPSAESRRRIGRLRLHGERRWLSGARERPRDVQALHLSGCSNHTRIRKTTAHRARRLHARRRSRTSAPSIGA